MASPTGSPPTPLRILVIGHNDTGKSSLINKLSGQNDLAKVGDDVTPTKHEKPLMELECVCSTPNGDIPITFCDTQGFYDMTIGNRRIAEAVAVKMKKANVILICHRLYEKVDGTVQEILGELAKIFGNDLMKHTILVFTKGDHYPLYVKSENNDEVKSEMEDRASKVMEAWKKVLLSTGLIKQEIVEDIPWCITSGREDALPTSDDWTRELWDLCEKRCTPEAKGFVSLILRRATKQLAKAVILNASVVGSFTIGGIIGTLIRPGIGSLAGAATGAGLGLGFASAGLLNNIND
uniref:AIG1-type G domain-containing protein n=1 Tax=Amphimedon queenslandica TaxID=400682 RepID=A0A1X7UFU1_AMPQE